MDYLTDQPAAQFNDNHITLYLDMSGPDQCVIEIHSLSGN